MKKFIPTIVLILLISLPVHAQFKLGVKGGVNINTVTVSSDIVDASNISGFQIGPVAEIMFGPFGIETGLLYSQLNLELNENYSINQDSELKNNYLNIPLHLKLKIGLPGIAKIYALAGPYAQFLLNKDESVDVIYNNVIQRWNARNFQAGLDFGAGIELFGHLQVGVNYGLGLGSSDNYQEEIYTTKNNTWSISATFLF